MTKRSYLILISILVIAGLWFSFRPDRLFTNKSVDEPLPDTNGGTVLLTGQFHSAAHDTSGTATVFRFADGKRVLRLTNLNTSNGPDLFVYLVSANDATDNDSVKDARFIDLGALHGNRRNQNYDVPSTADLSQYRAVAIWCRSFSVNFGAAPLTQQ